MAELSDVSAVSGNISASSPTLGLPLPDDSAARDVQQADETSAVYMPPPPPSSTPPCLLRPQPAAATATAGDDGNDVPLAATGVSRGLATAAGGGDVLSECVVPPPTDFADPPQGCPQPEAAGTPPVAGANDNGDEEPVASTPLPDLMAPDVPIPYLAALAADTMMANPLAPINVVQELLSRHLRQQSAAQRHTVDLAVEFGCNLVSEMAAHVIRETSAQFAAFEHTSYQAMVLFIVDQLQQWNRRLLLHRRAPPDPALR